MTYSLTTPVRGPVDVTVAQIVAAVLAAPQQDGWPVRTRYTDAELVEWAERGIHWTGVFGFGTAGLVGQSLHETNHLRYTGDVPFGTHNFAGIGATGAVVGERFDSIDAGWLAFCCHMALYVYGEPNQWPEHLRGYASKAVRLASVRWAHENLKKPDGTLLRFFATVTVWGDFVNGRWAHTQALPVGTLANRYAERSTDKANLVLAQPKGGSPVGTPYDHIIPGLIDVRDKLATRNPGEGGVERGPYERIPLGQKRGVVIHYRGVVTSPDAGLASYQADATYHVGKNWVAKGQPPVLGSGIMYHVGIDGQGKRYLLRDLERVLWHCGAWPQNANTLAIQLPLGGSQRATAAQLKSLGEVVDAWLAFTKAPRSEVWGHQQLSQTDCPGTLMSDFVIPYRNAVTPPAPPKPLPPHENVTLDPWLHYAGGNAYGRFYIPWVFVDWINANGGFWSIGRVVTGAFIEDGLLVQYFEGGRLEHHPENAGTAYEVLRGHTGLEVLATKHPDRVPKVA
jgi:hypothetical protein